MKSKKKITQGELKAMKAEVPGWTKLSKRGEAEMRRVAEDIAKTVEELAAQARTRDLPRITLSGERDLPPQVELTFDTEPDDFAKLLGRATMDISVEDQANLLVGEFIRRALVEMAEKLPKPPPQRCGNCEWFKTDVRSKGWPGRLTWGRCGAVEPMRKQIPDAAALTGCDLLHAGNGGTCPCHRYKLEDKR